MSFTRLRLIAVSAALAVAASTLLVGPALAAPAPGVPHPAAQQQLAAASGPAQNAAGWLTEQFTAGTHLQTPFSGTYFDDQGLTADGILALDSAGVGQSIAAAATSWLAAHVGDYVGDGAAESYAGPLAKTALISLVQGGNPRSFGGRDLITALQAREQLSGADKGRFSDKSSFGDFSNAITQSLAVLAERRATAVEPSANAIGSLVALRCSGGGFRLNYPITGPCVPDPDATVFAIQALNGLADPIPTPNPNLATVVTAALTYLVAQQQADGGVVNAGGGTATTPPVENSNSTGLAAVAFAVGGKSANAAKAYTYLAARQQTNPSAPTATGAINFSAGGYDPSTSLRATTQAIPGLVAAAPGGIPTDAGLLTVQAHGTSTAPVIAAASGSYRTVQPARLLDTRQSQPVPANGSITVAVAGRAGVPVGISAAAVNITAVTPAGPGFVIAYPSGTPRPTASNLNLATGVTLAAAVLVKVGSDGRVVLSNISNHPLNLVLDVNGYYLPGTGLAAGTYRPVTPTRLLDTRSTAAVPAGGSVSVQITGSGSGAIPLDDVSAAAVTVTAVGAGSPGYVAVYPAGAPQPTASTLNLITGQTIANSAIVRVGAGGRVTLINASSRPLNLLLDLAGYFIGGVGQFSGAFVSLPPARLLDTRTAGVVPARTTRVVQVGGHAGVPATGAAAIAYNLTAVSPGATGNVSAYPAGTGRPNTSNLNVTTGRTVANLSITGLSSTGGLSLFNDSRLALNLLVDVAGYYRT